MKYIYIHIHTTKSDDEISDIIFFILSHFHCNSNVFLWIQCRFPSEIFIIILLSVFNMAVRRKKEKKRFKEKLINVVHKWCVVSLHLGYSPNHLLTIINFTCGTLSLWTTTVAHNNSWWTANVVLVAIPTQFHIVYNCGHKSDFTPYIVNTPIQYNILMLYTFSYLFSQWIVNEQTIINRMHVIAFVRWHFFILLKL